MTIFLGTDHAGFALKEEIKTKLLTINGYRVEDLGALRFIPDDDYPDYISKASQMVALEKDSFGIMFGKSGSGECIVANKINGIRAINAFNDENVRLSREHNDANVICLGAAFFTAEKAFHFIELFLATHFSEEARHKRRLSIINTIENSHTTQHYV